MKKNKVLVTGVLGFIGSHIVDEVIEEIKLRELGSAFFRKKQLFLGDDILFFDYLQVDLFLLQDYLHHQLILGFS